MTDHQQCAKSIENGTELVALKEDINEQKEINKEIWKAINYLRNRLPVWATMFFSFLSFALGTASGALWFALNYLR